MAKLLTIHRTFDAPVSLVWKMWSDVELFKKWWGPAKYSCPESHIDFRVGGKYWHAMQGPDGAVAWSGGVYKEIVEFKKIVSSDYFSDKDGNPIDPSTYGMTNFPREMKVEITFEDLGNKTKMTLVHGDLEGVPEKICSDMNQGWNESFDKMVEKI